MRESIGRALNASDLSHEEFETAVDKVGALAKATDLGRALYHWIYGGQENAARSAYKHLLRKAQRRVRVYEGHKERKLLEAVVTLCLYEYKYQGCHECKGAGEFVDEEKRLKIICRVCRGSGKKRYSDQERIDSLNIDAFTYKKWENNIGEVWKIITGADIGAGMTCRLQLERS